MNEDGLLTGPPDPANAYLPGDRIDVQKSRSVAGVDAAAVRRDATRLGEAGMVIWAGGSPPRQFLHCDDVAIAVGFPMQTYEGEQLVNIGCGTDVTIRELVELVVRVVGQVGGLACSTTRPRGTPRNGLEVAGWAGSGRRRASP